MTRSFPTHRQSNRKPRRTFRPQAEGLEGRQLLTGPGSLDTSFDLDGSALAGPGYGRQVEVQRINGQDLLLVAGDNGGNIRITRLLPNGQIDSSFGSSGSVTLDFAGQEDTVQDLRVRPDGRFIVGANAKIPIQVGTKGGKPVYDTTQDFGVAVFQANGEPDTTFSEDGEAHFDVSDYVKTAFPPSYRPDSLNAVEVLDDGSILLAGSSQNSDGRYDATLIKVSATGTPDAGFGVAGVLRYRLPGYQSNFIWDLAVLHGTTTSVSDDRILVLETPYNNFGSYWAIGLARFTPSGQLDPSYGTNGGRTITAATDSLAAWKMAVRQDGSVIVTGRIDYAGGVSASDGFLASYTSAGLPDTSFGLNGIATFDVNGSHTEGREVAIDPGPTTSPADDKIYVTGFCTPDGTGFVARFDANTGLLDSTFGTNGIVLQQGAPQDLALQADGKIVTITTRSTSTKKGTTYEFLVYRYSSN